MKKSVQFFILIFISSFILTSFKNATIKSSTYFSAQQKTDKQIANSTKRVKLGNSNYFVLKPLDCIENVLSETNAERCYTFYPKDYIKIGSKSFCSIVMDRIYISRLKVVPNCQILSDTVLNQKISLREYTNQGSIYREGEFSANGEYFYFICQGISETEMLRFYGIVKSLSK